MRTSASSTGMHSGGGPKRTPFVLLVLGVLGAGLCALLALNTVAAADEVRQRSLTAANADTQDQAQQLQLDIDNRQAPAALASAARALGLVPNPNPAFLIQAPDGSVVVMGSPAPVRATVATPTQTPTAVATETTTPASSVLAPAIPLLTLAGGPR